MNRTIAAIPAIVLGLLLNFTAIVEAFQMDAREALSTRQQSIVPITAFTANGDMDRLKAALIEGLETGLTVNEIKEILVQMYAYAGFPRSLNGIHNFMAVVRERREKGIEDEVGQEASPLVSRTERGRITILGWD